MKRIVVELEVGDEVFEQMLQASGCTEEEARANWTVAVAATLSECVKDKVEEYLNSEPEVVCHTLTISSE